jgi:hypothetical protein
MWSEHKTKISNRKASDLLWRIRLNSLSVGSRLRHWNIPDNLAEFCGACAGVIQSHAHLFWRCPVACQLWNSVWNMALIAWPSWRLCRLAPSYEDIL